MLGLLRLRRAKVSVIQDYIKKNELIEVTKEDFDKFYIHNQCEMKEYFGGGWKPNTYFYNPIDLDEDNWIDTIYEIVNLEGGFKERMNILMDYSQIADDVSLEKNDGEQKVLFRYWWD